MHNRDNYDRILCDRINNSILSSLVSIPERTKVLIIPIPLNREIENNPEVDWEYFALQNLNQCSVKSSRHSSRICCLLTSALRFLRISINILLTVFSNIDVTQNVDDETVAASIAGRPLEDYLLDQPE